MGINFHFNFTSKKSKHTAEAIKKYVKERIKEKQLFNNQIEKLNQQLQQETIDNDTYQRLRDAIEINFIKQRNVFLEKTIQEINNNLKN